MGDSTGTQTLRYWSKMVIGVVPLDAGRYATAPPSAHKISIYMPFVAECTSL
jgi:hypothetical protein